MPDRDPPRITSTWPFFPELDGKTLPWPQDEPSLADAVASIVCIAAQRARSSGTLDALRLAVEAALQAGSTPAGDRVAPPCMAGGEPPQAPAGPG